MLLDKALDRKDKKLPYKVKGDYVKIDNLNSSLLAYIGTLEPEYQEMITITSGNDGGHSEDSRHYKNKAVDIRFDPRLYQRVAKDPIRKQMGVTLVDPNHGNAKHIHFSVGEGTENNADVWREGPKKDNRVKAYQILTNKGYDRKTALGIVGNLVQESGPTLDTEALGFDGTGSYGVAQWLGPRKEKLKEIRPNDYNTIEGQLEFLDWELNNTHKNAYEKIKSEDTVEGIATAFSDHYEIPNKAFAYNDKRIKYAQELGELIPEVKEYEPLGPTKDQIDLTSDFQETQIDNTSGYLKGKGSPTYASMSDGEEKKDSGTSDKEAELMALVEQYKAQAAQNTAASYQKQQAPQKEEEDQYGPQELPNTDHLYNYINIETYEDGGEYKVRKGDSLSKIAKANNMSLNELVELNPSYKANPNQLSIGADIRLKNTQDPVESTVVGPEPNYVAPQDNNFSDADYLYTGRPEVNKAIENARGKLQNSNQGYPNKGMESEYQPVVSDKTQVRNNRFKEGKQNSVKEGYDMSKEDVLYSHYKEEGIPESNTISDVAAAQRFLVNQGFDLNPNNTFENEGVDGKMGKITEDAIKKYNTSLKSSEALDATSPAPIQGDLKELKKRFKRQGFETDDSDEWNEQTTANFKKFKERIHSNTFPSYLSPLWKSAGAQAGFNMNSNLTEDNFSEESLNLMRRSAVDKNGNIRGGFGYEDTRKASGVAGEDVKEIFKTPVHNLTSGREGVTLNLVLGQAGIISAPDGYTYVYDDYDFNDVNTSESDMTPEEVYEARLKKVGVDEDTNFIESGYQKARARASYTQREMEIEEKEKGKKWSPSATLIKLGKTSDLLDPKKQKEYAHDFLKPSFLDPLKYLEYKIKSSTE